MNTLRVILVAIACAGATLPAGADSAAAGFALSPDGAQVTRLWEQNRMTVNMGGVVIRNGYVYGTNGHWRTLCLDLRSGNIMYESLQKTGLAATIAADGLLFMYGAEGRMDLVEATPQAYRRVGEFAVAHGTGPCWAHPALANGVLYLRRGDTLMAYAVAGK